MTGATRKVIGAGDLLPRLTLDGPDGPRSAPWPGNQATLLVLVHPGSCPECTGYLDEVAGAVDDLRSWGTQVVGVTSGSLPDLPFVVLGDGDGACRRRLGIADGEAAVLLADRWGEVNEVATFGADHGFPLPRQLVESAKIVDVSCGECNVPGPEWRETEPL